MKLTVAFDARCSSARCSPLHQGRPPCWCRRSRSEPPTWSHSGDAHH